MNDLNLDAGRCPRCMSPLSGQNRCPGCGFEPGSYAPPPHHLPPMTILDGKYLVGCAMGEGGFGITYMGWDLQLQARVAVKEYFPTGIVYRDNRQGNGISVFAGSGEASFLHDRERFLEEARMLARFDGDPGVVNVKNCFRENGTAYIVMEYVQGITLAALTEQSGGRLPFDRVMKLLALPMKTLDEMHRQGVFHRDISPENLMVTSGDLVKLIDFGSARTNDDDKTRFLKVRPGYSALEMYGEASREGTYSDIYSLCATIYRVTTGVTPPPAAQRVQRDTLVPPTRAGAKGLSPAQEQALLKGLAVQPGDRFQRVDDLRAALTASPQRRLKPRPRRALIASAALILALALGFFLFFRGRPGRFMLTEAMFRDAPELWAGYRDQNGYPCQARAYITGEGVRFTRYEGDCDWSSVEWRRDPVTGAQLKNMLDALRASGIPAREIVLQNLRIDSLEGFGAPWPNELSLVFDQCTLPGDWSDLAGLGDSLFSLHVGDEADCSDLSWTQALTRLRWLALGGEGIDLDSVTKLSWLQGLSFGGVGIEDLTPFTGMKSLIEIGLPRNNISDLSPLADMPQLEMLSVPNNRVEDLTPLAGLENLRYVDVTGNRITDFSPIDRDGIEIVGRGEQH